MTRYGMVINATLCAGCDACTMACKDEFVGNDWPGYSAAQPDTQFGYYPGYTPVDNYQNNTPLVPAVWVTPGQKWMDRTEVVRGTFPYLKSTRYSIPCQMCNTAPCLAAAKNGDVYRRSDGIIIIDPVLAYGRSDLPATCPYGKIFWNPASNLPQKCTFCAHLIDQGQTPKCVVQCHMSAITFGDLDTPSSAVATLVASGTAQALHPEYGTQPKVYYIGLPMTFLWATVVDSKTGSYLQGAAVSVKNSSGQTFNSTVDNYGEFCIDGLVSGQTYTLTISLSGYTTFTQSVNLTTDTYLGNLQLVQS